MIRSLRNALTAVKEGVLETAARAYLDKKIQHFGVISSLAIDSKQKTALIEVELKGEAAPVQVKLLSYSLIQKHQTHYFVPGAMEASRAWITAVLNEYVSGRELEIPAALKAAL